MKEKKMAKRRRMEAAIVFCLAACLFISPVFAGDTGIDLEHRLKPRDTSFYRDFFDSIFYERFAQFLRFDQLFRHFTFHTNKTPALDVNRYDEVPDSGFFENRQGRKPMSLQELKTGPAKGEGPDPKGPWTVLRGKTEGVTPGLFIRDAKGEEYLLKFDSKDNPEMTTSAEVIAHKFFHSFGYHVAEYYLVKFSPDILVPGEGATYYDENGFKKPLDQEGLNYLMEQPPRFKGGVVRASASKILPRPRLGYMDFDGRRKDDPDDLIMHEDRRAIRALRIFGSWLNHYDLRRSNTMDVLVNDGGTTHVKHYLIDFGSTLGSAAYRPKVPVAGYENIVDWYELAEEIPTFKMREKPWEKKWDESKRMILYPEIGYFDNRAFEPQKWTTQLPYEAFERLTVSDAFWAAKIIMSFTDEDIRSLVETGEYSSPEITKVISDILIERRNMIGHYWFLKVTPLDRIQLLHPGGGTYEIKFTDLAVQHGFAKPDGVRYRYELSRNGKIQSVQEFSGDSLSFDAGDAAVTLHIRAKYPEKSDWTNPPLTVVLTPSSKGSLEISEIDHGV